MTTTDRYRQYLDRMHRIADIRYASALLQWDQETYLPARGAAIRGQQIATLSELAHQQFTDPALGDLLRDLLQDSRLQADQRRNVELTLEDYTRNLKYPADLVRHLAEQVNRAFHSWIEARRQQSFPTFEKDLEELVRLKRQEAEVLGYQGHPYNALLHEFEKGCTVEQLDQTFGEILPFLSRLQDQILGKTQVEDGFLRQYFPRDTQWEWGMFLVRQLHFDLEAGRQDLSEHPFTINFASTDVRITTRVDEQDFGNMTWSCIHETGHALYEQGLPEDQYGLPLGEAASLSIHESQSRFWENNVGRSQAFWSWYFPRLQEFFPSQLGGLDTDTFYRGINKVAPSLIRTEADEVTYHWHVYIRYELEKQLIAGHLPVRDIPGYWNEQYRKRLGLEVPNDRLGCLQDVHWSHGSFGYFPTYSLGSFYAAQFHARMALDTGDPDSLLRRGETRPLLDWLRDRIHRQGRRFTSGELCTQVTGKPLDTGYFQDYLLRKYRGIYNL